ncbi:uncharacterized protein LOC120104201 [Phoenix dactylifera]|uniref:Uncharacterized protein LOC120104201 n=1 Tax=Phoenix dactylifera TaxID=42345 RepID=A0A8B8Z9R1_PHODC|nr:uncharacterized protein LOC120104201 [Phoenix dactylifera]
MPTSNASLFARLKRRSDETGEAMPKPRKKKQLESAEKRLAEAEAALAEAVARREATEVGRRSIVDELEEERAAHSLTRSALRASEARLAEARSEAAGYKYEGGVLRLKIEQLEAREKKALERAENAVELFKESEEFRDMLEEETVDGFLWGFENFRRQMHRYCPQLDLSEIRLRMGLSDGNEDEVPAIIVAEEELAEIEASMADQKTSGAPPEVAEEAHGATDEALTEIAEGAHGATDEASTEVAAEGSEPAPAEGPQVIAIDDLEGDAGAAAVP